MQVNYYDPETHKGIQPVRVLAPDILLWFDNIYPNFKEEFEEAIIQIGLNRSINYYTDEEPLYDRYYSSPLIVCVDKNKKINISETFLSYLWICCYSLLVLYEERMGKAITNKYHGGNYIINDNLSVEAIKLFEYGFHLVDYYLTWEKEWPNPESYDDDNQYIEITNVVFWEAMNYILCHEFAHVKLGHIDKQNLLSEIEYKAIEKSLEYKADEYAYKLVFEKGVNKDRSAMGAICGLCSSLFINAKLSSDSHPDKDERIIILLEKLNLEDSSPLWGLACCALILWKSYFNYELNNPEGFYSYKTLFYFYIGQIKDIKNGK